MNDMTDTARDENRRQARDISNGRFAWQDMRTMYFLRQQYSGKRRTTAVAIYQALSECASEYGRITKKHTSTFPAHLERIGAKAGKSVSTVKRYAQEFKTLRVLSWETRRQGKVNRPNLWTLLESLAHNSRPTSPHNNEPRRGAHNSELPREEELKRSIKNKGRINAEGSTDGLQSIGDILRRKPKL